MTLKKLIKLIDPIGDVVIWTQDDDTEPAFSGSIFDIPWTLMKYKIGRLNDDEPPIYLGRHRTKNGTELPALVINVIEE